MGQQLAQHGYTTIEEARLMREILIANGMPVAKEDSTNDYHNDVSGIYLAPWTNAGNQPEPGVWTARQYLYRLSNGYGGNLGGIFQVAYGQAAPGQPATPVSDYVPPSPPNYKEAVHREVVAYNEWLVANPDKK